MDIIGWFWGYPHFKKPQYKETERERLILGIAASAKVLHAVSPLCKQTVAHVRGTKSVCLMTKAPECPSKPETQSSFGLFRSWCRRFTFCKRSILPFVVSTVSTQHFIIFHPQSPKSASLGSESNQSGLDIALKSICIAFSGGHTPALRPRKVPKPAHMAPIRSPET